MSQVPPPEPLMPAGPLPKSDASSALRRDSVKALQNLLPSAEFVFREEDGANDYGVDGTLEILTTEGATNMRAHLQIKGRSATTLSADGSCSVSIETSNLNYLLNGSCPIYVLFRPEKKELRFAFARPEWKRISAANPDWCQSGSITVRFLQVLDVAGLQTIRDAVIREHLFVREVAERVTRIAGSLSAVVTIDPNALSVTDSEEIVALLNEQGYALVTDGAAELVATKARHVPEARRMATPHVQLVLAFAEYSRGRYVDAEACLRLLLIGDALLSERDRSFATYLLHSVDLVTGRTTQVEFEQACWEWRQSADEDLALQFDIAVAWERYRVAQQSGERRKEARAAEALSAAVRKALGSSVSAIRQQAELLHLLVEAQQLTADLIDINVWSQQGELPWKLACPGGSPRNASEQLNLRWSIWHSELVDLARSALRRGDRELACRAGILRWATQLIVERHLIVFRESRGMPVQPLSPDLEKGLSDSLASAKRIGNLELELQATLELATLSETAGDEVRARSLAAGVATKAKLCRYANLERAAQRIVVEEGFMSSQVQAVRQLREVAPGDEFLHMTDRELEHFAGEAVSRFGLPMPRVHNMLESLKGQKLAAQTRRDWCQHIVMAEEVGGQESLATFYAEPSAKRMHCMKLNRHSAVTSSDPQALMIAFKRAHCEACEHRQPSTRIQ